MNRCPELKRSQQFAVRVPLVSGVTTTRMGQYLKQAIERWADHLPEGNPLRGVFRARERSKVSVRPIA